MAPSRKYMLLAAKRLAMLVNMIRAYRHPGGKTTGENDTINVVGHSQGTLITLLANALLKDEGKRPVDAVIMMNPPYSLLESRFERMEMSEAQQTTKARVTTLANIVGFIGANPNPVPTFAQMADPQARPASVDCVGMACNARPRWRAKTLPFPSVTIAAACSSISLPRTRPSACAMCRVSAGKALPTP